MKLLLLIWALSCALGSNILVHVATEHLKSNFDQATKDPLSEAVLQCVKDIAEDIYGCRGCAQDIPVDIPACKDPSQSACWLNILRSVIDCWQCMGDLFCIYEQCCTQVCAVQGCKCWIPNYAPFINCTDSTDLPLI